MFLFPIALVFLKGFELLSAKTGSTEGLMNQIPFKISGLQNLDVCRKLPKLCKLQIYWCVFFLSPKPNLSEGFKNHE